MTEAYRPVCSACPDRDWQTHRLEASAEFDVELHNGLVHPEEETAVVKEVSRGE